MIANSDYNSWIEDKGREQCDCVEKRICMNVCVYGYVREDWWDNEKMKEIV